MTENEVRCYEILTLIKEYCEELDNLEIPLSFGSLNEVCDEDIFRLENYIGRRIIKDHCGSSND